MVIENPQYTALYSTYQYPATVLVPFFECVLVSCKFLAHRSLIHAAKTSSMSGHSLFCQLRALSCCSSVRCTFGTGNNFKLKCCIKRALFPNKCRSEWVGVDTDQGQILFQAIIRYYSTCRHYLRKYGTFFWTCGHDLLTL